MAKLVSRVAVPIDLSKSVLPPLTCSSRSAGATCCCLRDFFGYCFTWACCPLPKATCCDDQTHCCPAELPVCDTAAGRCLKVGLRTLSSSQLYIASQTIHSFSNIAPDNVIIPISAQASSLAPLTLLTCQVANYVEPQVPLHPILHSVSPQPQQVRSRGMCWAVLFTAVLRCAARSARVSIL